MVNKTNKSILFAGGGSGGHIFPAVAIAQRLKEGQAHFLVSNRAVDKQIMTDLALDYTASPATPLPRVPWKWPGFLNHWRQSISQGKSLIQQHQVAAVVTVGGFVCGPAATAARKMGVPVFLLNLDATPGKANRWLARRADELFTVYPQKKWPNAHPIGLPIRREAIGPQDRAQARTALGLSPGRRTLLVTGASQGATSINRLLLQMLHLESARQAMTAWQVLHLAGQKDTDMLRRAYRRAGITAVVEPFLDNMGLAWRSASVAISRAGAGSVAEVWANEVPTIFLPYPFHRDQHQRKNALPLVQAGAALMFTDQVDPTVNAHHLTSPLIELMHHRDQRMVMSNWLKQTKPADGAQQIADALQTHLGF